MMTNHSTTAPERARALSMSGAPEINRRRLLLGLAAASTAAAVGVEVALAAPAENPELVRLGDELPAVEAAYRAARAHQNAVDREWAPQWPIAPEELAAENWDHTARLERDFYGAHHGRKIRTSSSLEWRINNARSALKSRAKKNHWLRQMTLEEWERELVEMSRLHEIALRYEAECDWITKAANYRGSWEATHETAQALAQHITNLMEQPETTMAGVIIKAQAMAAWGRVDREDQVWSFAHPQWPGLIAAAILRHAEGGAA